MLGHARGHDGIGGPGDVGPIRRPELAPGEEQHVGEARQAADGRRIGEVAGEGRNAVGLETLARLARREARDREHAAAVAGPFGRAAHPARERGPHLAAGAEDQDVGLEAGDRGHVFVCRLGEQSPRARSPTPIVSGSVIDSYCQRIQNRIAQAEAG